MSDDNPIISGTEHDLAWATWQISRGHVDSAASVGGTPIPILDATPEEKALFENNWTSVLAASLPTMKDRIHKIWWCARQLRVVRDPTVYKFIMYWQSILDAQPAS
jgi:hypothetical protein